ncbi:TPA: LOW QUALITY PROTEIN: hypothetical protein N0F65_002818 [Lagenidium giganteum]|uniref:Uncharacterized protein n=1 Tax=Lagenidium giganteum TaxID=4803 RepID=A0AAV2ZG93_9STRA|nr:TPA: LOW QUALITY PROTEIN: hypothetical protein N0F65_002818 [Lagenidium giganteum]
MTCVENMLENHNLARMQVRHVVGQTGCFCMDCLKHRKQEWRIGDVNPAVVGPRDHWKQFAWGNAERLALCIETPSSFVLPIVFPLIKEKIHVHDSRRRNLLIERDAKFTTVASGKYHTLMLSGTVFGQADSRLHGINLCLLSQSVFAFGDNSYGALGHSQQEDPIETSPFNGTPIRVDQGISEVDGGVQMIAASGYASFALGQESKKRGSVDDNRRGTTLPHRRSSNAPDLAALFRARQEDLKKKIVYNHRNTNFSHASVFSWGRGDRGILGLGDSQSSHTPRIIECFNTMRVQQVSAGLHHVLVLTELDGVYAFGDGAHGKLGVGDTYKRVSPARIYALEGLNFKCLQEMITPSQLRAKQLSIGKYIHGVEESMGPNACTHSRLGHNDDQMRLKPARINYFRGRRPDTPRPCGPGAVAHTDNWDIEILGIVVDEVRHENIRRIDAGERHSLAISENRNLWVWGQGIHGEYDAPKPDFATTSILTPTKASHHCVDSRVWVELPGMELVNAVAGRGRTLVWGDRGECFHLWGCLMPGCSCEGFAAIDKEEQQKSAISFTACFAGTTICSSLPEHENLSSGSFRIIYKCGPCGVKMMCIACAHQCHVDHCLELAWTLENTLSRDCDCYDSGKCSFDDQNEPQFDEDEASNE